MALLTGTNENYYEGANGVFNNGDENYGNYQFISLKDIVGNFLISYVGEGKIIPRVRRQDVLFHAQRAIQELSYDTFKSTKAQEIEIPPSLTMPLPHDYVNYVKITFHDDSGLEHVIYPARKTSNPTAILQDGNFHYTFDSSSKLSTASDSDTWTAFSSNATSTSQNSDQSLYEYHTDTGKRFGLNPENAQSNGVFFIDELKGRIHFSSDLCNKTITLKYVSDSLGTDSEMIVHKSELKGRIHFSSDLCNKTITLKYVSDSLGTDSEMIVHKFAEEAMYKWIAHAILSTRENIQEYIVQRFKKEKFAAIRQAKLRLSNIKIEELTQVMRGKSKQIKH